MRHASAVRGLARVLEGTGALRPDAHHDGNERLGHGSCSWNGGSQHPGPARGESNGRRPAEWRCVCTQCFFTFEEFVSLAGEATDKPTCVELSVSCAE